LSKDRRTRFDFFRRRWLRRPLSRRSFPLPVILNLLAVALCVFILGMIRSSYLVQTALEHSLLAIPALPLLPLPLTPTFATLCLAKSKSPLFAFRYEKALPFYITQHAFALYRFAKAFEQMLLRLTWFQCDRCQLNSPPSTHRWVSVS
jgi:hypothetical protein